MWHGRALIEPTSMVSPTSFFDQLAHFSRDVKRVFYSAKTVTKIRQSHAKGKIGVTSKVGQVSVFTVELTLDIATQAPTSSDNGSSGEAASDQAYRLVFNNEGFAKATG